MLYDNFAITIANRQGAEYPVFAVAPELGRVVGKLEALDPSVQALLVSLAGQATRLLDPSVARTAGTGLFRWLLAGPLETHFRLSWDRAARLGHGLRVRLSIDPPELAGLPWELLHDPTRDHGVATSASTPLVRYLDRADSFGGFAEPEAELPLAMLLVLPSAPGLDLARERAVIQEAVAPLRGALNLHVLEGPVTRVVLSDTLQATPFDIVHVTTHGGTLAGETYLQLNAEDGSPDWIDAASFARFFANARALKLAVLNACSSGQVADNEAFRGMAPQLVRAGAPAVVAMQYTITDQAALAFAREFYRQLCTGQQPGQVDVALAYARNVLAALFPDSLAFAAPVLYTHAAEGGIFHLPESAGEQMAPDLPAESARLAMFMSSLEATINSVDDWTLADQEQLEMWHRTLLWAERAYSLHLEDPRPAEQQAARHGLGVTQARLASLEEALERVKQEEGES